MHLSETHSAQQKILTEAVTSDIKFTKICLKKQNPANAIGQKNALQLVKDHRHKNCLTISAYEIGARKSIDNITLVKSNTLAADFVGFPYYRSA
jgi:hypothetical protein